MMIPLLNADSPAGAGEWVSLLVRYLGIPGAMMAVIVWGIIKGHVIRQGEAARIEKAWQDYVTALQKAHDEEMKRITEQLALQKEHAAADAAMWRERYEELKGESLSRLNSIRHEKDMWRDTALKATNVAIVATEKVAGGPQ